MLREKKKKNLVEISGFEPEASRMQSERSTAELYPPPCYLSSLKRLLELQWPIKRGQYLSYCPAAVTSPEHQT